MMKWVNESGLAEILPELLKTKVYVGVSAGSMVTGPDLQLNISQQLYKEDLDQTENMNGLNLVVFYILPHYNSSHFSLRHKDTVTEVAKEIKNKIYALDDMSAVKVIDGAMEVISEGDFFELN